MDFSCEATSTNYFVRLSILTMSSMISYSSSEHHILIILSFIMIICVVLQQNARRLREKGKSRSEGAASEGVGYRYDPASKKKNPK